MTSILSGRTPLLWAVVEKTITASGRSGQQPIGTRKGTLASLQPRLKEAERPAGLAVLLLLLSVPTVSIMESVLPVKARPWKATKLSFTFSSVRRAAAVLICAAFCSVASRAQSAVLGYVIAGPAGVSGWLGPRNSVHVAGGGEFGFDVLGVGGELGYWTSGLGMASVNGSVSPTKRGSVRKTIPFLTAGYTTGFTFEGSFNAWNLGGGANYWISARRGLRVDFRDHIRPDERGTVHYWSIRAGLAFR